MSTPRERILELVANGTITAEAGQRLLEAMDTKASRRAVAGRVFDPFRWLSPSWAFAIGAVTCAASIALAVLADVRFDGALDLHITSATVTVPTALLDQAVAWPLVALVFFAFARAGRSSAALFELLAYVGASRLPFLLAGLLTAATATPGAPMTPIAWVGVAGAVAGLGAGIVLLLSGFRTATGWGGGRLAAFFVPGVLVAEIVSKLLLALAA